MALESKDKNNFDKDTKNQFPHLKGEKSHASQRTEVVRILAEKDSYYVKQQVGVAMPEMLVYVLIN